MAIKLGGGGGVTIPIGAQLNLYDTAETVVKGSETFLRNGVSKTASDFPNAVVRNYLNTGTVPYVGYGSLISPWAGDNTPNVQNGGACSAMENTDGSTNSDHPVYFVTTNGYCNLTHAYGATFVSSRYLADGVIFPTGTTNIRPLYDKGGIILKDDQVAAGQGKISFSGTQGGVFYIAVLSADMQTLVGRFSSTPNIDNPTMAQAFWRGPSSICVVHMSSTNNVLMTVLVGPTAAQFSAGTGALALNYQNTITYSSNVGYYGSSTEIVPWQMWSQRATYRRFFGMRTNGGGISNKILYWDTNNGNNGHSYSYTYDHANITAGTTTYRAPMLDNRGFWFTKHNTTAPSMHLYNNYLNTYNLVTAYDSSAYKGYAYKSSTSAFVGHDGENKIFEVIPSTGVLTGTTIDTGGIDPYRLAYYNNILYNLKGTQIVTYNTTTGSHIANIDISSKVSGTNATGIAHDGSNIYVLDGSNSKIHKYDATGSSYVSFVTLADTPHTLGTLHSFAADATSSMFYVLTGTNIRSYTYAGAYGEAFVAQGGYETDMDYYSDNVVMLSTTGGIVSKKPANAVVGNPSGTQGTTTTTYIRVA